VRATTQISTRAAPACLSVRAISAAVLPVVITSSTTATLRPRILPRRRGSTAKAPRTLPARSSGGSASWCGVSRTRTRRPASARPPSRDATRRASSHAWLKPRSRKRGSASGTGTTSGSATSAGRPAHASTIASAKTGARSSAARNLKAGIRRSHGYA